MTEFEVRQIVRDELNKQESRIIHQSQLVAKMIKQRHIDGMIIFRGLAADLPTDDSKGIQAYFAYDTGVLYIWDGDEFLEETLT